MAAVKYLKTHPKSTGKIGAVGFCWGGAMANQLAVHSPDLSAAVPYYGRQPASEDVPKIKASLLLHYAGIDERINKGIAEYEAALKKASVDYKIYMYEGAQHAFNNNDTNVPRYNKEAAQLARERTLSFLRESSKNKGHEDHLPKQHFLYFWPLPQGQGSLRPVLGLARVALTCAGKPGPSWDSPRQRADSSARKGWQWVKKRL